MSTLTTLQLAITILYIGIVVKNFGVLSSISASSYEWNKPKAWLFWAWLAPLGVMVILQEPNLWGVFSGLGLYITGLTLWHKEGFQEKLHITSTVTAIGTGLVGFVVVHSIYLPLILFAFGTLLMLKMKENRIWWIEILAIATYLMGYVMR